jgi:hypothetical protein
MLRGPLARKDYRPQFSGHETFPLRYGWLKKASDAVRSARCAEDAKKIFSNDDAIARFGVGRNMVASIRHWAITSGIIREGEGGLESTEVGDLIFGSGELDPYLEHPSTLWLLHWHLAGHPEKTTWFWAFNHFQGGSFERDNLVRSLGVLAAEREWSRAAAATIKRDVECFVRVYVAKSATDKASHEDALESPLAELGLIRPVGRRDGFRFVRGAKPTLGNRVFLYALIDFWQRHSTASTLSFEAIAHEPGSPGRVFLLDEDEIFGRLQELEDISAGALRWSETAGLKQVIRDRDIQLEQAIDSISADYIVPEFLETA